MGVRSVPECGRSCAVGLVRRAAGVEAQAVVGLVAQAAQGLVTQGAQGVVG